MIFYSKIFSNFYLQDGEIVGKTRSRIRLLPTKVKPRRTVDSEFEESAFSDQTSEPGTTTSVTSSSSKDVKPMSNKEQNLSTPKNKGTKPKYDVPRSLTLAEKLKRMNLIRDQDTSRHTPVDDDNDDNDDNDDEDDDDEDDDDDDDADDSIESVGFQSWDEDKDLYSKQK